MEFGNLPNVEIQDFGSNKAQIVFPEISEFNNLYNSYEYKANFPFSTIFDNAGAPLCDLANGINTQVYPTNSTLLREGMVHSVNYTQILQELYTFNGTALATLSLPPVPPGWGPLDNPDNTPLYSYNIPLAAQYVNQAGIQGHFFTVMTNGTVLGDAKGSPLQTLTYNYVVPLSPLQQTVNEILSTDLAQVGSQHHPTGYHRGTVRRRLGIPSDNSAITGVGWCADWPDPIFQQFTRHGYRSGPRGQLGQQRHAERTGQQDTIRDQRSPTAR